MADQVDGGATTLPSTPTVYPPQIFISKFIFFSGRVCVGFYTYVPPKNLKPGGGRAAQKSSQSRIIRIMLNLICNAFNGLDDLGYHDTASKHC